MLLRTPLFLLLSALWLSGAHGQTAASALTEQDFLTEVPIVLSVSRLAQRLDETPGAMTILDREFIRMSGARDVADLLRFVPGFHSTTSFETDSPVAYYHGRNDDWANRLQVLVDGRSVYSTQLQGAVGLGLQTLSLDDIERIEVFRGSNSAAYGARAFLGVVNIVSRNAQDTSGHRARLALGENRLADAAASIVGTLGAASYRVSVDTRGDDGLRKVFPDPSQNAAQGGNRVSRVNFSSTVALEHQGELALRAGVLEVAAYRGTRYLPAVVPDSEAGNWERLRFNSAAFVQADAMVPISGDEDVRVSVSRTQMRQRDGFPYLETGSAFKGITIGFSGDEINDTLSAQHSLRLNRDVRGVWGGEWRQEQLQSRDSFDTDATMTSSFSRLFGHVEWRFAPGALLNVGALWEQSSISGANLAPRAMVNWSPVPEHTLRMGVSSAFRTPSYYEKNARVVYYSVAPAGTTVQTVYPNPDLKPEWIVSREMGYRWDAPARHWALDVRLFEEQITEGIAQSNQRYQNTDATVARGYEWQLEWKPSVSQRILLSQTRNDVTVYAATASFRTEYASPKTSSSLAYLHRWGAGWEAGLFWNQVADVALMSARGTTDSFARTDLRVARKFAFDRHAWDLALVVQNLNDPYRDGDRKFFFDRRAYLTLSTGF